MLINPEKLCILLAASCISLQASAGTLLTGLEETNVAVPADHGSNLAETPTISLTWDENWDQYADWLNDTGGGIYQLDAQQHTIAFAISNPNLGILIETLDLNVWAGGGETIVNWKVTGSVNGILGSGSATVADGSVLPVNLNIGGNAGETLTLEFDQITGDNSYLAMDNLAFSQVIDPIALIRGDANEDGTVDLLDYTIWQNNYKTGTSLAQGDVTRNGVVDIDDFILIRNEYPNHNGGASLASAIPEPTSLLILGISSLALLKRRLT